jgi:hypothetical protein
MLLGVVCSQLVFEPRIAVLVDERHIAVKARSRTSGVGGATGGRLQVRQQDAESERRHHADRDPEEEQRAARPCGLIAEHGKSVSGWVARALPTTPRNATNRTINSTMTSI